MDHVPPQHQHDADDGSRYGLLTTTKRRLLAALALLGAAGFLALGIWQLERRVWKLDLVARVEARIHAAPSALPSVSPGTTPAAYEYQRVRVTGTYRCDAETLTRAVTQRGAGYWVMTPLETARGTVLVNRGFLPGDLRGNGKARAPEGQVTVIGLLRAPESGGGFLRTNDPASDQWYSRDVAAIARARGLGPVAPFFIDAEASPDPHAYPVGGLTVVRFSNNHLVYALTWFALAGLCGFAVLRVVFDRRAR
jgi:surfeit locus 1 family protein